jgi:hypothetical protein
MIIDAHAYCFPPLGEANGFPTVAEHLQYLQREIDSLVFNALFNAVIKNVANKA